MAQGKKDSGKESRKKASASPEDAAKVPVSEAASVEHANVEHASDHAHGHHKPNRKEYMYVFLALAVLTAIEVAVAQVPGLSKTLLGIALVGLAVTKAAIVGLYYMHLKHETRVLRLTVAIPMATPAVYALVLITEGAWRLAR